MGTVEQTRLAGQRGGGRASRLLGNLRAVYAEECRERNRYIWFSKLINSRKRTSWRKNCTGKERASAIKYSIYKSMRALARKNKGRWAEIKLTQPRSQDSKNIAPCGCSPKLIAPHAIFIRIIKIRAIKRMPRSRIALCCFGVSTNIRTLVRINHSS